MLSQPRLGGLILLDKLASLTPEVRSVALNKATEAPFSGSYLQIPNQPGSYLCRRCGQSLWSSQSQFVSHCGWPSFDTRLEKKITETPDDDGIRIEILCSSCHSHLGHVFRGEGFTLNNQRDCVNSVMLDFVPFVDLDKTEEIIIAGGCFWGVEYLMQQEHGVLLTACGYTGGKLEAPDYQTVCQQQTGHYEAVRVLFDPNKIASIDLFKIFFEIHDPTQSNGQGPDLGSQYQSVAFYYNEKQKQEIEQLMKQLSQQGLVLATKVLPVTTFWQAESSHQNYYYRHQQQPYCHVKTKRF